MKKYKIGGMSCAACVARVEKAVSSLEGVKSCSVSLLTNSLGVEGDVSDHLVIKAVENAGYSATPEDKAALRQPSDDNEPLKNKDIPILRNRLTASAIFLVLLMYVSMGHVMWNFPLPRFLANNPMAIGLLQLLLSAMVMVINQRFFISGCKGLIHRAPNMDTLVSLGSMASFVYSVCILFLMSGTQGEHSSHYLHELYFESAAMILTLITVGKLLEAISKGRTTSALKGLMDLSPKTATLVRDGEEVTVPIENVNKGDKKFTKANVRLESDIDLNGREWEPIGNARTVAFSGVFNGNGYVIKNFSIKSKNKENKGFFGFLKGEVYNLTVDCIIKGIGCCGALVA
jgi:Cu2+-exporting ATPase